MKRACSPPLLPPSSIPHPEPRIRHQAAWLRTLRFLPQGLTRPLLPLLPLLRGFGLVGKSRLKHLPAARSSQLSSHTPELSTSLCKPVSMSPASHPASNEGLQDLFNEQRKLMDYFFDNLEYEPLANFCKEIMACKGVVFFSGVGKSGFIAQKISMTLVSTGTKAVFLNPTDALHGDIGIVSENDLLVLFTKSGSTSELLTLIPYARAKGAKLIGVSSVKGSKLDVACDMHVHLPLERELCPFDLAPVTSTAIQMLFGDTVAIALMKERNLTQEEYAKNHPAGRIGKRLLLKVSDVMNAKDLPFVKKDVKVIDSLVELSSKGAGCVLVVGENNVLEGTFTDGDLRRALQSKGSSVLEQPLEMVATKTPRTINEDAMAVEAMKSMEEPTKVTFLPVVNDSKQVTGIITLHGLVTAGL